MANKGAVLQSAGTLLLLAMLFLVSPARVQSQSEENEYRRKLEEAYNASGIPWDQVLDDSIEPLSAGIAFDCDTNIETEPATNVNRLTPADIKVLGALGDSITAAMGAESKTIFTALREYRGVSWSIGGDGDLTSYTTLPNIIKQYNPNVKGFSVAYGGPSSSNAKNNVAVSGAIAQGMPGQARTLVDKIKADPDVNVDEDWKLITLWIGGNDLCAVCNGKESHTPENYSNKIKEALNILKELPRTFVNLVKILDVTELVEVLDEGGLLCQIVHRLVCTCGITEEERERTAQAQKEYNEKLQDIVDDEELHTDDFTVVLQPFMENVEAPRKEDGKVDMSYFAIDCFHFKTKGHRVAAAALWNNMMEPVGSKNNNWDLDPTLKCPPEGAPYFYTKGNSQTFDSFGAVPNADSQPNGEEGSPINLLAVLLGTGVAVLVTVLVVIGGVIGAVWYKRRQHRRRNLTPGTVVCDTEKVYLIRKN